MCEWNPPPKEVKRYKYCVNFFPMLTISWLYWNTLNMCTYMCEMLTTAPYKYKLQDMRKSTTHLFAEDEEHIEINKDIWNNRHGIYIYIYIWFLKLFHIFCTFWNLLIRNTTIPKNTTINSFIAGL